LVKGFAVTQGFSPALCGGSRQKAGSLEKNKINPDEDCGKD